MTDTTREVRGAIATFLHQKVKPNVSDFDRSRTSPSEWVGRLDEMGYLDIGVDGDSDGLGLLGEWEVASEAARVSGALAVALVSTLIGRRLERQTGDLARSLSILRVSSLPHVEQGHDDSLRVSGYVAQRVVPHESGLVVIDPNQGDGAIRLLPTAPASVITTVSDGLRGLGFAEAVIPTGCGEPRVHSRFASELGTAWRILFCAVEAGLARGALEAATQYAKDRHQFGHAIGYYGEIQSILARCSSQVAMITQIGRSAASRWDLGDLTEPDAARALLIACQAAMDVCDRCQHVFGGYGHMAEYPIGRYARDARAAGSAAAERIDLVTCVATDLGLP